MVAEAVASTPATPAVPAMTRREFLYYIWAASMALVMAETGGALLWFSIPRFPPGTFGGVFELDISELPPADSQPKPYDAGRFWLVNLGEGNANDERLHKVAGQPYEKQTPGVKALYKVCVHLGCIYKWVPTNNRFECPCHGSKYLPSGVRVGGPARRNLDVFYIEAVDNDGKVLSKTEARFNGQDGTAIDVTGAVKLRINTGKRFTGAPNGINTGE